MSRLSPAQRRVIETPGVTLEGYDASGRPVVTQMAGIPQQLRRWALLRSGDPTDVEEPVSPSEHR